MAPTRRLSVSFLILAAALLTSCGGGGGSGGGGGGNKNGVKGFGVVSGPFGASLAGLNQTVVLSFTKAVDAATVNEATVGLVTVSDSSGQSTAPGGLQASVTYSVDDKRVLITPTLEFDSQNVTFGFVASALYEISFADPDVGASLLSVNGAPMTNSTASFFFRTPTKALDSKPGFPMVRSFFVDDTTNTVIDEVLDNDSDLNLVDDALDFFTGEVELQEGVLLTVPFSPIRDLVFIFDDAVIPSSVFNSVDGSSPSIRVLINTGTGGDFVPIVTPATLSFLHQQGDLTIVRWRSDLTALPPGGFLLVEVNSSVEDLAGNSKLSLTGDFTPLLSSPVNTLAGVDPLSYLVTEDFDTQAQESVSGSSAAWASPLGELTTGLAGGLGGDRNLVVDASGTAADPGTTDIPVETVIDFDQQIIFIPTVGEMEPGIFAPRSWEFRRVLLPVGWTLAVLTDRDGDGMEDVDEFMVQSPGHPLDGFPAPLVVRATSDIDLAGDVLAEGIAGEVKLLPANPGDAAYAAYLGQGGRGGQPFGAAGPGGDGGDVLLAVDTDADGLEDLSLLNLVSPAVSAQGTPFEAADPRLRGATGRSSTLTPNTLADAATDLSVLTDPMLGLGGDPTLHAQLLAGEILLQPNLGVGSSDLKNAGTQNQFIDENHPSFTVTDVTVLAGESTITIDDASGGSMNVASKNIGNGFAPIAAAGDAYLVGRLRGYPGQDPSGFARGAPGADPFVVVNDAPGVTTTGGGGGGGGGLTDGVQGGSSGPDSDPADNQRGKGFGGVALDDSSGGAPGLGAVRGVGRAMSDTEFDWVSQSQGTLLADLDPMDLVGSQLLVNTPSDGWAFEVESLAGMTFTVKRVESFGVDIGLLSGPAGASGPGLSMGADVNFLLLPREGLGGAGGGGSGVSISGTLNASAMNLPLVSPGSGGGSGGGALELECAEFITVRATSMLSVNGGDGGELDAPVATYSGGGGGSAGLMTLRAGTGFKLFAGASLEARGGFGGGDEGFGRGGDGGSGWIRFENTADNLNPGSFLGFTDPQITGENVGRLVGSPRSVGESRFYNSGLANPEFESLSVAYAADTDGDDVPETDLVWTFDEGGPDGGAGSFERPPFQFLFNPTEVDINGLLDVDGASPTYYEVSDLFSGRAGFAYDADAAALLYSVGESTSLVTDLMGATDLALPDIPSVGGGELDIVSMTVGGTVSELYLLERGQGRVHVFNRTTGLFQRTIFLPAPLEGAMTFVPGAVPADDRLLIASNRDDLIASFPTSDPAAGTPETTDYRPATPTDLFKVQRNGEFQQIEYTGMAYDALTETVWAVDPLTSQLIQFSVAVGMEGVSTDGVHGLARLVDVGLRVVPSAVAFDGTSLHILRSTDSTVTSRVEVDPASVSLFGADLDLPDSVVALPDVARSIADGKTYLRFRVKIDGEFVDELHTSGSVSFSLVSVDSLNLTLRNAAF